MRELRTQETRNDEFMRTLLEKTEHLELFKVDSKAYEAFKESNDERCSNIEMEQKDNHIHYIQIENYLEKYLPLSQQKAIGKSIMALFGGKSQFEDKYRDFESKVLY